MDKGYELSRDWFDFCFDNPELIKPPHSAMYFFAIECLIRCRSDNFFFRSEIVKNATGIKNDKVFNKVFNDLVEWGFIVVVEMSKNKYSSTVIHLPKR